MHSEAQQPLPQFATGQALQTAVNKLRQLEAEKAADAIDKASRWRWPSSTAARADDALLPQRRAGQAPIA